MSGWMRWWRRNRREERLEKELRFHLDQHQEDLIARGRSVAQAGREARMALGGPEQVKQSCRNERRGRWLEEFYEDVSYALRGFRLHPGFACITLLITALGIGATTVMFTVIHSVLLKPLAFSKPDELVVLHGFREHLGEYWGFSYPNLTDIRRESRSMAIAWWTYSGGTISAPGEAEYVDGRQISSEVFSVLGISPQYGRAFRPQEDGPGQTPVAIISYGLWKSRFAGNPQALGAKLVYDGKDYVVVGVMPAGFQLSGEADVFTPIGQSTDPRMRNRAASFIKAVGRVAPGVTPQMAQDELTLIHDGLAKQYPKSNAGARMLVRPLLADMVQPVRGTLWLLLAAVSLVLFLACTNIASLFLTRAVSRERELAMRAALGATRGRMVRQCLTESAVFGLGGGVLGVIAAAAGLHPFIALWPAALPRADEIHIDLRVLAFAVVLSLLCGLFFGLIPALRLPMHRIEPILRGGSRTSTAGSSRLHSPFVISEIALAVILLVSAGMLVHSLLALSTLNPGFDAHNVLTARFSLSPAALEDSSQIRSAWEQVLDRARQVPGVQAVALADIVPMRDGENVLNYRTTASLLPAEQEPFALATTVTPDYLKVMGISLQQGRFFDEHDRDGSEPVVVIDEHLAQHAFGSREVVGKRLWIDAFGPPVRIVGVVGHVRHWGLAGDDQSQVRDQIYYPFAQVPVSLLHFFSTLMSITVRTETPPLTMVKPLQRGLRGAAGDQVLYEIRDMEQLVSASLARQRFLSVLFGSFAGLALFLACIGVYGVLSYLTRQRTSEIGVRMAVGANTRDVIWLVLRQTVNMIAAGVGIGLIGAVAASRFLQHLVEGMGPVHPATFVLMTCLLVFTALLAGFIPALRASLINPVQALRQE